MRRIWLGLLVASALGACSTTTQESAPPRETRFSLLAFGDHGYHHDYLEPEERTEFMTPEAFIANERAEWIEDRRPIAEFEASPMVRLSPNEGYVAASGMMPVANAMRAWCAQTQCDAGVLLGDNIYPDGATRGADGRDDATRFEQILRAPYAALAEGRPDFRIYASLGNHDWRTSREGALDQVAYLSRTPPFYMDGLFYSVRPPGAHGDVEIFVLDTHVLLSGATVYEDVLAEDGSEVETGAIEEPDPWARPANDAERNMAQWLEAALANSTARWRIVIGHHPLWSSAGSKFQQARTLRSLILPALCRYADMYLAGHEHTLELHTDDCSRVAPGLAPLPEVVSGAAAKQRPLNSNFVAHQRRNNPQLDAIYQRGMVWGFSHIEIEGETATVRMISTPDEGEHIGAPVVEFERTFARRSGVR